MKKDITNKNNKNQYHGYQEFYLSNDKIECRVNYKNGQEIGYEEWHLFKRTNYYIR